ncbi:MAG: TetR/AcrR family transcriptional regulator [Gemmatimonadaceae bacterium]
MVNTVKSPRDKALDAAFDEFSQTGDISMRKVGDAAGVSAAALYYHFASKQKLLDAVGDRGFAMFDSRLRAIWHAEPSGVVIGILDGYRQFAADHANLFGLMFVEPRPSARKFPSDFGAHRSAVFNLLWKAVGDCMEEPDDGDHSDSLYLAHDLWALAHGQILLWRAGRFSDERAFREVLRRSIDRFLDAL